MKVSGIDLPIAEIEAFCKTRQIRRLALFGSILRDDFISDSDIDILVEFESGVQVGWEFFKMQEDLSELIGRKVDLNTPAELSKYFRDKALREAKDIYVAAL